MEAQPDNCAPQKPQRDWLDKSTLVVGIVAITASVTLSMCQVHEMRTEYQDSMRPWMAFSDAGGEGWKKDIKLYEKGGVVSFGVNFPLINKGKISAEVTVQKDCNVVPPKFLITVIPEALYVATARFDDEKIPDDILHLGSIPITKIKEIIDRCIIYRAIGGDGTLRHTEFKMYLLPPGKGEVGDSINGPWIYKIVN